MAIGRTFPESLQKALRSLEQGRLGLNADPAEEQYADVTDDELLAAVADSHARADLPPRRAAPPGRVRRAAPRRHRRRSVVPRPAAGDRRGAPNICSRSPDPAALDRSDVAAGQAPRLLRRPAGPRVGDHRRRCPYGAGGPRRAADVQDGRHLRRRVRRRDAVPLLDVGGHRRGAPVGPAPRDHPRVGTQPHRSGDRVRLLLRPRQLRPARRRLRDGDGQLQPRDRLDRLRHVGPALLRAAHRRGRRPRHRRRDGGRGGSGAEGHRLARRPDAVEAGRGHPRRARRRDGARRRSTSPRIARSGTPLCAELHIPQPPGGTATDLEEALQVVDAVGFPVLVRPSYVLGGRAMQIVHDRNQLATAAVGSN